METHEVISGEGVCINNGVELKYEPGVISIFPIGLPYEVIADIMGFLFQMEKITGLRFHLDVKRPPRDENWQCSIVFDGKDKVADFNADICLFLEEWQSYRDDLQDGSITAEKYNDWKDKTLAYYSSTAVNGNTDKSE